jgi:hypothetical protein
VRIDACQRCVGEERKLCYNNNSRAGGTETKPSSLSAPAFRKRGWHHVAAALGVTWYGRVTSSCAVQKQNGVGVYLDVAHHHI